MKKIVEFKNVCKKYDMGEVTINALENVNFSIDEGEFVVILGASGAGKTTILNILGGMDLASSGDVLVGGDFITKFNKRQLTKYRREQIGFVFQFYNLIPNLTALENVEFATGVCKNFMDAKEMLERVGLADRLNNFPTQLSGGEQQRVAIARAIAKNPLLLLCDEPTGALDYETGKKVLNLLYEINNNFNKTVTLITHNSLIAPMADKIIHVKNGTIEGIEINENKIPVEEIEW